MKPCALCVEITSLRITTWISINRPRYKDIRQLHRRGTDTHTRRGRTDFGRFAFLHLVLWNSKKLCDAGISTRWSEDCRPGRARTLDARGSNTALLWALPALLQEYNLYRRSHARRGRRCRLLRFLILLGKDTSSCWVSLSAVSFPPSQATTRLLGLE